MDSFKELCEKHRRDPETGRNNYCIIQAEDELSAAGLAIGAGWAGARAFTNTSGPGISLMQEFVGLAYYTEIPAVFFDIQRTGPSTGMPTRTQQADLMSLAYASHGDTKHIVLFPCSPEDAFYLSVTAFDLADRFQTPVFVASDLDIGMNDWMCKRLQWDDDFKPDRGKCLTAGELEEVKKFSRYLDAEGDGIAARSLPGVHGNGAYFVRGSGHDKHGAYTEDSDSYQEVVDRLKRKFALAATKVPAPAFQWATTATTPTSIGITSVGGCHSAVVEALDRLRDAGIEADYMRIRAFPFDTPVRDFLDAHEVNFVVEQNRDAQLRSLLAIETGKPRDEMIPVLDYGGLPLTAHIVVNAVTQHLTQVHA